MKNKFIFLFAVGLLISALLGVFISAFVSSKAEWARMAEAVEALEASGHWVTDGESGYEVLIHEDGVLSESDLENVRALAPGIWIFKANGSNIDDDALSALRGSPRLEVLRLERTRVSGKGL